jgi:hypothetical protein
VEKKRKDERWTAIGASLGVLLGLGVIIGGFVVGHWFLGIIIGIVTFFVVGGGIGAARGWGILVLVVVLGIGIVVMSRIASSPKEAEKTITIINATVTSDALNFRASPSGDGVLIRTLYKGDVLTVTGEKQNGFLPVEYNGEAGFVSGNYVAVEETVIALTLKSGIYKFNPRILGTYFGANEISSFSLYLAKIEIDEDYMTLYLTNKSKGKGTDGMMYYNSRRFLTMVDFTLGPASTIFLRDLDHPDRVWKAVSEPWWSRKEGCFIVQFQNVTSGKLEFIGTQGDLSIPEIILPERAYIR